MFDESSWKGRTGLVDERLDSEEEWVANWLAPREYGRVMSDFVITTVDGPTEVDLNLCGHLSIPPTCLSCMATTSSVPRSAATYTVMVLKSLA